MKRAERVKFEDTNFDTVVKSDKQFAFYVCYILQNPVTAKLCKKWTDWTWSGCNPAIRDQLNEQTDGLEARAPSLDP